MMISLSSFGDASTAKTRQDKTRREDDGKEDEV